MRPIGDKPIDQPRAEKHDAADRAEESPAAASDAPLGFDPDWWRDNLPQLAVGAAVVLATFLWTYWPTLVELVRAWDREPDYSHGFFVAPLAIYFLWARRDLFPGLPGGPCWLGLGLIGLSILTRIAAGWLYIDALDGWSIMVWFAGVAWLIGGRRVLWWALPSIGFLWFMVPLPFRAERIASYPLQTVATKVSCWVLQCLGQPALASGHTILLGEHRLQVEEACSGLRIFVGIVALAFAYVILVRRPWWEKGLLLASVLPIALIANATRIVVTGLLYQWAPKGAAVTFSHDVAGWVMIPYAAALFGLTLWYLGKLMREVEQIDVRAVARRGSA